MLIGCVFSGEAGLGCGLCCRLQAGHDLLAGGREDVCADFA